MVLCQSRDTKYIEHNKVLHTTSIYLGLDFMHKIFDIKPCPNKSLYHVHAIWVAHGTQATWAALHWSVIPQEWRDYADGKTTKPQETNE